MNIFIAIVVKLIYEIISVSINAFLLMLLWNWSIPNIVSGLSHINLIQSIILILLSYILSGKLKIKLNVN